MQAQVHARTLSLGSIDDRLHAVLLVGFGLCELRLRGLELPLHLLELLILEPERGAVVADGLVLGSQLSLHLRVGACGRNGSSCRQLEGVGVLVLVHRCLEVIKST